MAKTIHDERYKRLVSQLRECRIAAGLSQVQVAERLGVTQSFVSDCENGERRIDVVEFLDLIKMYGANACEVLKAADVETERA